MTQLGVRGFLGSHSIQEEEGVSRRETGERPADLASVVPRGPRSGRVHRMAPGRSQDPGGEAAERAADHFRHTA
jgi:hypothetical protein